MKYTRQYRRKKLMIAHTGYMPAMMFSRHIGGEGLNDSYHSFGMIGTSIVMVFRFIIMPAVIFAHADRRRFFG
jgi:hypothetical protein